MVRSRHKPRLHLSFSKFVCPCGERERVRGVPCPTCNRRPAVHEFDELVQRRRRVAASVRDTKPDRSLELTPAAPLVFAGVFDDLITWIKDFFDALNQLEEGAESARVLTAHLLGLHEAALELARFRPWRGLCGHIETALTALVGVWSSTLDAYSARTMIEARQAQRRLQIDLDAAGDAMASWERAIDQMAALLDMTPDEQVITGASWSLGGGNDSSAFADEIIKKTQISSPLLFAARQFIALGVELANTVGERDELGRLTQATLAALRANNAKCKEIIDLPVFRDDFSRAIGEMYRSSNMTHLVGVTSGNERLAVDALVKAAHTIFESTARPTVALLAASLLPTGYRATLQAGAAACVRTLRDNNLSDLTIGLDLDLRNAEAHRSWRITADGGIDILNDRRTVKRHLTGPELLDTVIAGNITSYAMIAGVVLYACEVGADLQALLESDETLPVAAMMQIIALTFGWPRPEVTSLPGSNEITLYNTPEIEITFDPQITNPVNVLLALANKAPETVDRLILVSDDENNPTTVQTANLRAAMTAPDTFSRQLAFIRVFHSTRRGGEKVISLPLWNNLINGLCKQALNDDQVAALRKLLKLRTLLRSCQEDNSCEIVTTVIENLRKAITGQRDVDASILAGERPGRHPAWWAARQTS